MKKLLSIISIIIVFASCQKDVNVEIPYDKDRLVLNSLFTADSSIYTRVFISQKLTNNYQAPTPANPVITLLENNVPVGNFTPITIYGTKWYKSPVVAQTGKTYKIIAAATGYPTVEGEDQVPAKAIAQISSVAAITTTNVSDFDRRIKFKIQDDGSTENFYLIKVYSADTNTAATGPRFKFPNGRVGFQASLDGLTDNGGSGLFNYGDNDVYLTDETFNGREVSLSLSFDQFGGNYTHFAVEVTAVSKATYRYLKSLLQQQNSQGDPFAEASIVYNNITNGFGIVGAANERILFIRKL